MRWHYRGCKSIAPRPIRCCQLKPLLLRRHLSVQDPNINEILRQTVHQDGGLLTAVGLVKSLRKQKKINFVELVDGSTSESLKVIIEDASLVQRLSTGASVAISGKWQAAPAHAQQDHELVAQKVEVLGLSDDTYPVQSKFHTPEFLRTIPHLRLRTTANALLARLRSEAEFLLTATMRSRDFIKVQTPMITSSDCEGAGQVFRINPKADSSVPQVAKHDSFFGHGNRYLTVSSQLHLEAFGSIHPRVWTLSPTFRAERSDTPRHLCEFWMFEAEIRTQSLEEVMQLAEDVIRDLACGLEQAGLRSQCEDMIARNRPQRDLQGEDAISGLKRRWDGLVRLHWPRISYSKAIDILQDAYKKISTREKSVFEHEPIWGHDLNVEHERFIAREIGQGCPVFVTDYPRNLKPFYMLPSSSLPSKGNATDQSDSTSDKAGPAREAEATVACFDLLLPETAEIVGGSLREHRYDELQQSMRPHEMTASDRIEHVQRDQKKTLSWYLDLRRYGSVPHGGFGLGFDRLLGYLTCVDNIKDVVPWPRHYGRCDA